MFKKYSQSIKSKLIINVVLIHTVLMGLIVFDIMERERNFMSEQLSSKGFDMSSILASNSSSYLLNGDLIALNELISDMSNISDHYMVFILDRNFRVKSSLPKSYFNKTLNDDTSKKLFKDIKNSSLDSIQLKHNALVDTVSKIYVDGRVIGYSRVILDSKVLLNELQLVTNNGLIYVLFAVFLGAIFAYFSVNKMTYNLNYLVNAANRLANKDFDIELPKIDNRDEVGAVAEAFKIMQKSLHEYLTNLRDSQERLKLALEGGSDGLWDWNLVTNEIYFSPRWKEMLGYNDNELKNSLDSFNNRLHPDDKDRVVEFINEFLESRETLYEQSFRMQTKDKKYIPILARAKKLVDERSGKAIRLVGTHIDMSELTQAQEFLQKVIDSVKIPLMVIKKDYTVSLMNSSAKKLENNKFIKDTSRAKCYEISHQSEHPCDTSEHPCPLKDAILQKRSIKTVHIHVDKKGHERVFELLAYPIMDNNGEVDSIVETAYEITSLVKAKDSLKYQAEHDALTQLPNRILFIDRFQQSIKYAKRVNKKIAILFLDLDHFKEINDSLGHNAGDMLLQRVSKILQDNIRESDTVARLGGDEFVVMIDNIQSTDMITDFIQRVTKSMSVPQNIEDREFYTTFSIGVSIYPNDGDNPYTLLKNADTAMYRAKSDGRNRYQFYTDDMTQKAIKRVSLEADLRSAIEIEEFVVFYQPQVDARSENIIGLEALVRWFHNDSLVSPAQFIPLAEEIGIISSIDYLVMKQALKDFVKFKHFNPLLNRISLNLSVLELEGDNFIRNLEGLLNDSGCKANWVELEITESQIMKNPKKSIEQLLKISDMGIKLSIDDFGTGYSSLSYLRKLPISKLKIDKSFIDDIESSKDAQEIVKTVVAMANNLNLSLIAEGVETAGQKEFLIDNGCFEIQGYYYYKPMSYSNLLDVFNLNS
jgi:diguanylate cyclase (GGDEF)-like protein/PAS domain S-box-containing protein